VLPAPKIGKLRIWLSGWLALLTQRVGGGAMLYCPDGVRIMGDVDVGSKRCMSINIDLEPAPKRPLLITRDRMPPRMPNVARNIRSMGTPPDLPPTGAS
jgi:hypothetical protein